MILNIIPKTCYSILIKKKIFNLNKQFGQAKRYGIYNNKKGQGANLYKTLKEVEREGCVAIDELTRIYEVYGPERLERYCQIWIDMLDKASNQLEFIFKRPTLMLESVNNYRFESGTYMLAESKILKLIEKKEGKDENNLIDEVALKFAFYLKILKINIQEQKEALLPSKPEPSKLELQSTAKQKGDKLTLVPKDKPKNKELLFSVLQHFNIIDKKGKAIPAPLGKAQFINGIIDALKQKNILTQHPHTTLHKLLCKELNITYKRVSLRKNKTDGAYTRGLEETLSYRAK